jgi:hypothetical protein
VVMISLQAGKSPDQQPHARGVHIRRTDAAKVSPFFNHSSSGCPPAMFGVTMSLVCFAVPC